jgi:tetratricopeptide (TPR) repeat protein
MERVSRIASYRSSDNTLILELKAYNICSSFGKDADAALAFLLGHELTHFYQEHDWGEPGFGTTFLAEQNLFSSHQHEEEEADVYGAFVAHTAGYNSLKIIPLLLDKLYEGYKLDVNLKNYPSLKVRKEVVVKVSAKVQELITIYDNANYFVALGWQVQAAQCYEHLLKFVKTKELYQNLGTSLLATLLQQQPASYWYPIEIELGSILRDPLDKSGDELANMAEQHLKSALKLDANYVTAHNNLAILYSIRNIYTEAEAHLKKAAQYGESVADKAQTALIKGIILAQKQQNTAAEAEFQLAYNYTINSSLRQIIAHNQKILQGERYKKEPVMMSNIEDLIDRVPLVESPPSSFKQRFVFNSTLISNATFQYNDYPSSILVCFEQKTATDLFSSHFALQRSKKQQTSKGVAIGTAVGVLRKIYDVKQTAQTVQCSNGYFLIYRSLGLIFKINKEERLEEWGIFTTY